MRPDDIWNQHYTLHRSGTAGDAWIGRHAPLLEPLRHLPCLDLGCGSGENAARLHAAGFQVLACDFSATALQTLSAIHPDIETACFDMTRPWPAHLHGFGLVLASLSTHYFTLADTRAVYRRVYRSLAPGGVFILRVNSRREFDRRDKDNIVRELAPDFFLTHHGAHKRYFAATSLAAMLGDFARIKAAEGTFLYRGHDKHYVEAIAHKAR